MRSGVASPRYDEGGGGGFDNFLAFLLALALRRDRDFFTDRVREVVVEWRRRLEGE